MRIIIQTQDFRIGQANEPCIWLTQENLIENSIQDYLPYILNANSPYFTTLSLPVKIAEDGLNFSYFPFSFLFSFRFISLYSILRTRVRVTRSYCYTANHLR